MSTKTFFRLALEACKMGYALDLKKENGRILMMKIDC